MSARSNENRQIFGKATWFSSSFVQTVPGDFLLVLERQLRRQIVSAVHFQRIEKISRLVFLN